MASCRGCGSETHPVSSCPSCEETVQWKCGSCSKETDLSIHTHEGRIIGLADIISSPAETFAA